MVKFRLFYLKPQPNRCGEVLIKSPMKTWLCTFPHFRNSENMEIGSNRDLYRSFHRPDALKASQLLAYEKEVNERVCQDGLGNYRVE